VSESAELEQAAIRLLTNREHSRAELRRKLQARSEDTILLDQVLDSLESGGYLSDERFAEQYVSYRKKKGFGPVRIRIELQERGISSDLVNAYADPSDDQWFEWLGECCRRKFGDSLPVDFKAQAKCARFLEYRGFPSELIRHYLWGNDL
jgi:regulatory protein